jgi:hypothetical protein
MKRYKLTYLFVLIFSLTFNSCNTEEILKEVPLDFYSPGNSYTTPDQLNTAIVNLYYRTRNLYYGFNIGDSQDMQWGTDLCFYARDPQVGGFGDYPGQATPTSSSIGTWWKKLYGIIAAANTVIDRSEFVKFDSELQKNAIVAEAKFFRAYAYRNLAYVWGGVPLSLNEVTTPKTDYTRATQAEVYTQIEKDFLYASQNLPDIKSVKADGRVSREAALHYLGEVNIAQGKYSEAVAKLSEIIDNSNFKLMTDRFGAKKTENGDVFWDLFRNGNYNRSSGNTEAIWVMQEEHNVAGGEGINLSTSDGFCGERFYQPAYWLIPDPDGLVGFIGPTTQNGGRGAGEVKGTDYFYQTIWQSDFNNDIRNSKYNIVRDWIYDNPKSKYYGKSALQNRPATEAPDYFWKYYPQFTKFIRVNDHPADIIQDTKTGLLYASARRSYLDQYYLRLAETYLLRAEAYINLNNLSAAAKDINVVRSRAKATPVAESNVNIDYVLDERMRELGWEEQRRLTLCRVGKLVERTRKYNIYSGKTIQDFNKFFPIPYAEIEKNTGARIEQNPGYEN